MSGYVAMRFVQLFAHTNAVPLLQIPTLSVSFGAKLLRMHLRKHYWL